MITGNKGEWSEVYAFFKILGDKVIYGGDGDLNRVESLLYPILKVIRYELNGSFEYSINDDLVLITGDNVEHRIPVLEFSKKAIQLLNFIKSSKGSFSIPEIEEFMKIVNCSTLKANSSSKIDIIIRIYDQKINSAIDLGFSIKSQVGNDATILNAGRTTNLIYKLAKSNISKTEIQRINQISTKSKIKDRILELKKAGIQLEFQSFENSIFKNNLILIDSSIPQIISEILLEFYSSKHSSITDLLKKVEISNPLNFDYSHSHKFYEIKIKRLLSEVSLGMMPSKVWDGVYEATGGYIIVKEDGEVLCYHIYSKNQFEDYLFRNTKLETASSTRHKFGEIYLEEENFFIKLNLQIRFK
jgi:type II restriction enzyme